MPAITNEERFQEFHEKNPEVFILFRGYAYDIRRAGRKRYSARTIIHLIRWHNDISTNSGDSFKINNNHSPYYARMLEAHDPSFIGFFSHRS